MSRLSLLPSLAHRRWRTAIHEAGHAVAQWHLWARHNDRHGLPFWSVDVYRKRDGGGGGQVSGCYLHFNRWESLLISLAGPLAEDGAARTRELRDAFGDGDSSWWDFSNHEPMAEPNTVEWRHSDFGKVRSFLDELGAPDGVLDIACAEAAVLLWEHRKLVYEIARRAYRAEFLYVRDLVDLLPGVAEAVAEYDRQRANAKPYVEPVLEEVAS